MAAKVPISEVEMRPFRKKNTIQYVPKNRLESILIEAASHPHTRGDFFRQIFHFDLLTLGDMESGNRARFETSGPHEDGSIFLYVFTSLEALQYSLKKAGSSTQRSFLEMKASSLFEIARLNNFSLIINQGHDHGLILPFGEIKTLLSDSNTNETTLEKGTSYLLDQPSQDYPDGLISTLKDFVSSRSEIASAYLGWIVIESDKSHKGEYYLEIDFLDSVKDEKKKPIFEDLYHCINEFLDGKTILISDSKKESIESGSLLKISSNKEES